MTDETLRQVLDDEGRVIGPEPAIPDADLRATSGPVDAGTDWPAGLPRDGTILLLPIRAATGPCGWLCCVTEAPDAAAWEEDAGLLDGLASLAARLCESHDPAAARELAAAAERRLETHDAVARVLAETSSLDEAAPALLATICRHLGFAYGILREVDRRDQVMRHATVWHEPDPALAAFAGSGRSQSFSPGVGMTGHAWATGRPIWVPDCRSHPVFERQQAWLVGGVEACASWAFVAWCWIASTRKRVRSSWSYSSGACIVLSCAFVITGLTSVQGSAGLPRWQGLR